MAPYTLVDTADAVRDMLQSIVDAQKSLGLAKVESRTPLLYVDIEGDNLCRDGTVSLIQMHIPTIQKTFILDIFVLGDDAFTTSIASRITFKSILESPTTLKCFFDVRADSDALYNLYNISMAGVVDVQLMENASRPGSKRFLNGLARAIREDAGLSRGVLTTWLDVKERGKRMFLGSSDYKAFEIRPIPPVLLEYCINVRFFLLSDLHNFREQSTIY